MHSQPRTIVSNIVAINRGLRDVALQETVATSLRTNYRDDIGRDWALDDTLSLYDRAMARNLPVCDVRFAARLLARILQPRRYLEIGVRRGWSLLQVVEECPEVEAIGVDLWLSDYGDYQQGSPATVMDRLHAAVGTPPHVEFLSGDSHKLLRDNFGGPDGSGRDREIFDLVTIDGDHHVEGVFWDVMDVVHHIRVGGALIVDDLDETGEGQADRPVLPRGGRPVLPPTVKTILELWVHLQSVLPNFVFWTPLLQERYQAGIALRVAD